MATNALAITSQYPVDKFNLLVPIQTVAEISDIHRPVMNVVTISTNLEDREIYLYEKAKTEDGKRKPARYAITKKGLTKLMRAAGIRILGSRPVVPTTCQKCAEINRGIGKPVHCGSCPNKDVKYECCVGVPQLTGESLDIVVHKEIIVEDACAGMKPAQKAEFLRFRAEICESKALNRALRIAMQIKNTYLIEEFRKPFVVAYLVPNLDHEQVRERAIEGFFSGANELYGRNTVARRTIFVDSDGDPDDEDGGQCEMQRTPIDAPYQHDFVEQPAPPPPRERQQAAAQDDPDYNPNICQDCGKEISDGVVKYSLRQHGTPLCMSCQKNH